MLERYCPSEKGFYLFTYSEVIEYRYCALIDLYNFFLLRGDLPYIFSYVVGQNRIIYMDTVKRYIQHIEKNSLCPVQLPDKNLRSLDLFSDGIKGRFPFIYKF